MKLKMYTLFSILSIVIVGAYVHLSVPRSFGMEINGALIDLPISVWIIIPMIFMYLASLSHMAFYWFLNYFKKRALEKDIASVKKVVLSSLKGEECSTEFTHKDLSPVGKLLKNSQIVPMRSHIKTDDVDLDKLLFQIDKLNGGDEADLASFKLSDSSPLKIRNAIIKLKNDPKYSEEILKKFPEEKILTESAIEVFVTFADKKKIEKYKSYLTKKAVINILARYKAKENSLFITHEDLVDYIKTVKFVERDFIVAIKKLKDHIDPEEILAITYELKRDFPEALDGWLYINLELERLDEVNEVLDSSDGDEYLGFRKYLAVRNSGIQASVEEFVL